MTNIQIGDYILITDKNDDHYLQIGHVDYIERDYYDDIEKCWVQFANGQVEFNYKIEEQCKVLMFYR